MTLIYDWAPLAARYRDPRTGRFVSREAIKRGVDQLILASQGRITTFSNELRSGTIDIAQWQEMMREEIKSTQLTTLALVKGGWKQLTQSDFGTVGNRIKEQYLYLEEFTQKLIVGSIRTDGQFMNYARMYAASARIGYHEEQQAMLEAAGYTSELNVLHPAEHCGQCVDCTSRGWVAIGTNPPIGSRTCLGNDRCSMSYK